MMKNRRKRKRSLQQERKDGYVWFFDSDISDEEFKKRFNELFNIVEKADECLGIGKTGSIGKERALAFV